LAAGKLLVSLHFLAEIQDQRQLRIVLADFVGCLLRFAHQLVDNFVVHVLQNSGVSRGGAHSLGFVQHARRLSVARVSSPLFESHLVALLGILALLEMELRTDYVSVESTLRRLEFLEVVQRSAVPARKGLAQNKCLLVLTEAGLVLNAPGPIGSHVLRELALEASADRLLQGVLNHFHLGGIEVRCVTFGLLGVEFNFVMLVEDHLGDWRLSWGVCPLRI
jgi:hypothetical protein